MGKPVICNFCPIHAWVDSDELASHMKDHEAGYCAHKSLDEPGRRCHRYAGHDGDHSEFPRNGDYDIRVGLKPKPDGNGRKQWRGIHDNVAALREALGDSFTANGIVQWLWTPRVEWDGLTPLEMIAIDRLAEVVAAAEQFAGRSSG